MSDATKRGLLRSLDKVLEQKNATCTDGTTASFKTQAKREQVLNKAFEELWADGYKLPSVDSFGGKHVEHLAKRWESEGKSPATIQNRLSILRTFADWIEKPGMIKDSEKYVEDPESVTRSTIAEEDKSWTAHGVDPTEKIQEVAQDDERAAAQLKLMRAFGLRQEEAAKLKVHGADKGGFIEVAWGTKGGRDRIAPVQNEYQREALEAAKELTRPGESLIPSDRDYAEWRNHFYYECRKNGISKSEGLTPHGLRHEFLNDLYEEITGTETPVRGGNPESIDEEIEQLARQEVAERAGHNRRDISNAYIGSGN